MVKRKEKETFTQADQQCRSEKQAKTIRHARMCVFTLTLGFLMSATTVESTS